MTGTHDGTGHRGAIYYLLGRSASGKDTIGARLLADARLGLSPAPEWTTRPRRPGEGDTPSRRFVTEEKYLSMEEQGEVLEARTYHTAQGDWRYFTPSRGPWDSGADCLMWGPPAKLMDIRAALGPGRVIPIRIAVPREELIIRSVKRAGGDRKALAEACRRYLADEEDFGCELDSFSHGGVFSGTPMFSNRDLEECVRQIAWFLLSGEARLWMGRAQG